MFQSENLIEMRRIGGSRIQRDERSTSENFESEWPRLIGKLRGYSEKQYMRWGQVIHQNWKQTFERKFVYILGTTDMVLDSYLRQIANGQVTPF